MKRAMFIKDNMQDTIRPAQFKTAVSLYGSNSDANCVWN
jgi:hypothetical protein